MAQFIEVPTNSLDAQTLQALLAEYASRDGTDYGEREFTLDEKINQLRQQLDTRQLTIVYDADSQAWDLVDRDGADELLRE